jgi:hypothetical protein
MKKFIFLNSVVSSFFFSALVLAGGQDSGGGNIQIGSTPEQVERIISKVPGYIPLFIHIAYLKARSGEWGSEVQDFTFQASQHLALGLNFKPIPSGSCAGPGGEDADASTTMNQIGAPICLSVNRLTRIPPYDLFAQIVAITFHELSHQFGADEVKAKAIQSAVLKHFDKINMLSGDGGVKTRIGLEYGEILDATSRFDLMKKPAGEMMNASDFAQFCMHSAEVRSSAFGFLRRLEEIDFVVDPVLSDSELSKLTKAMTALDELLRTAIMNCMAKSGPVQPDTNFFDSMNRLYEELSIVNYAITVMIRNP